MTRQDARHTLSSASLSSSALLSAPLTLVEGLNPLTCIFGNATTSVPIPDLYSVAESSMSGQIVGLFQLAGVGRWGATVSPLRLTQNHHNIQQSMLSAYNGRLRCWFVLSSRPTSTACLSSRLTKFVRRARSDRYMIWQRQQVLPPRYTIDTETRPFKLTQTCGSLLSHFQLSSPQHAR